MEVMLLTELNLVMISSMVVLEAIMFLVDPATTSSTEERMQTPLWVMPEKMCSTEDLDLTQY